MADEQNVPSIRTLKTSDLLKRHGNSGTEYWSGYFMEEPNAKWRDESRVDVVEEMRRSDGSVRAVLSAIKTPILSTETSITPASDDPKDQEIAQLVEYQLFNMRRPFQAWLREALSFLDFGHYVFEKIWIKEEGRIRLADLEPRIPHSIQSWEIGDREKGITQRVRNNIYNKGNNEFGFLQYEIPWAKLFILTNDQEGDDVTGQSVLRAAYTHYFMKTRIYRMQAVGIERGAVGVPVGEYPDNAGEADKTDFESALANLRANDSAYILHKPGYKIEILTPSNNPMGSTIKDAIDHHARMILLTVLAEFLDLGSGSTGSFALSKDQSSFFLQHLQEKADYIAEQMNMLIKEIVDLNFTGVKAYPTFHFSSLGTVDFKEIADILKILTDAGLVQSSDIEIQKFMRASLRLPELKDETIEEMEAKKLTDDLAEIENTGDEFDFVNDGFDEQPVDEDPMENAKPTKKKGDDAADEVTE